MVHQEEIRDIIINQVISVPIAIIESRIKEQCREIINIMLICRSFKDSYSKDLSKFLSILQ